MDAPLPRQSQDPAYFKVRMAPRRSPKPPVLQLVQEGDSSALQRLLRRVGVAEAGEEVTLTTDGEHKRTALHYAACTGNAAILQILLHVPVAQMKAALTRCICV